MKLTLGNASIIVDKTLEKGRELKIRPLCVAVLDEGGHNPCRISNDKFQIGHLRPVICHCEWSELGAAGLEFKA